MKHCELPVRQSVLPGNSWSGCVHLDLFTYQVPGGYGDSLVLHVCLEHVWSDLVVAGFGALLVESRENGC